MLRSLTWQSDERCVVGEFTFQTLPVDLVERERPRISMEGADFLLFKERPLIERYVELFEELRPQWIFELGIMEGGSTVFLNELTSPRRLVAIDRRPPVDPALRDYVSRLGPEAAVQVHFDVDQEDRERLSEITDTSFDGALDLVIDDCSHLYAATRASFNELFPRLRPGGLYMIEDWSWAHTTLGSAYPDGLWTDEVPLTRLIFELVLAVPSVPDLVSEITIEENWVEVRRGRAEVDPRGFEISSCSNARGRSLLAPDARVADATTKS
jgi:hypothetical protein